MSVTYPENRVDPITEENFIPVYARRGKQKKAAAVRRETVEPSRVEPVSRGQREEAVEQPVFARRPTKAKGGVKTWMILAPVGVIVLGGIGAMMVLGGGEETAEAPLVEPAATAPVLPATPFVTDTAAAPLTSASTPAPVESVAPTPPAPAPVTRRETAPAREAAPVRRSAPAARQAAPAVAPAEAVPAEPTGPRPYSAAPATTSTLNATPAATSAPAAQAPASTPRQPAIATQPLN